MAYLRRQFLKDVLSASALLGLSAENLNFRSYSNSCMAAPNCLPRWRGFSLNELKKKYMGNKKGYKEEDFRWISSWGFDFVRLQLDYKYLVEEEDWQKMHEPGLQMIDQALEYGEKYKCHVCLTMYRAPGHTLDLERPEKTILWKHTKSQQACEFQWAELANRYKKISNKRLSFNPINEPFYVSPEDYKSVMTGIVRAIHSVDSNRLIICDGRDWGWTAPHELSKLPVAFFTRGFKPYEISHYKAKWIPGSDKWPVPVHPVTDKDGIIWTKDKIRELTINDWIKLQQKDKGVMVGMFGCYNKTPHNTALLWMKDSLALWKECGWGWSLWSLRGPGGIINSGRKDVNYEDFNGIKLDRKMLQLLQEY